MHGFAKKACYGGLEAEFSDFEQGLDAGLPRIRIGQSIDLQPLSIDVHAIRDPDVKVGKLDATLKSGGKSFNDPVSQDRLRPNHDDANDGNRKDHERESDAGNPLPPPGFTPTGE
jgi:hypothetical protein